MPSQRKAYRKVQSRLRYRARRMNRMKKRSTVVVNRALSPFAQRYICKMKYATQVTNTGPGGAGWSTYRFNLNSIYDPDQTGLGHQPYGHDTLQSLYNRYRVIKCNYTISAISTGGTSGNQYTVVAALPANEVHSISRIEDAQETPKCKFITQAPNSGLKILKGSVYLPSLMGRSKAQYMADDRYQATYGTSPNELAILNIYAGLLNGAAETITTQLNIVLEYVVESFDFKVLPQS